MPATAEAELLDGPHHLLAREVPEEGPLEAGTEQQRGGGLRSGVRAQPPPLALPAQVPGQGVTDDAGPGADLPDASRWRVSSAGSAKSEAAIGMTSA
ncbi:hypothetical protein [Streptomyces sp. NPDC091259]|uniref:hypothetical protein n=1 Tax=Streptomyces sp. NPDC091259 TaxID=3365976 RepID=UPI003804743F